MHISLLYPHISCLLSSVVGYKLIIYTRASCNFHREKLAKLYYRPASYKE